MTSNYETIRIHALGDVLREHRRSRPRRLAAVDGPLRLTWPELDARVSRLCGVLREAGIATGDRVVWLGQNSVRLMELLLACAKLGAVCLPANWRMSGSEMTAMVEDFGPALVFWQEAEIGAQVAVAREALQGLRWIRHDTDDAAGYEALLAGQPDIDDDRRISPELPVLAICTAAFQGRPNAALLSHSSLMFQSMIVAYGESVTENTVFLNSGPLFHLGTMMTTLATMLMGGCNVFVPRVTGLGMLRLIETERITHAFIPKPTLDQIRELNADGRYDTSSLWPTPDAEWVNARVGPPSAPFLRKPVNYGQTEIGGIAVYGWLSDGVAGRPAPGMQVRIVDAHGQDVQAGEVGEIAIRGALVMNGYYNRPEENRSRIQNDWYLTHDLGRRHPDGSIAFIGPKTTMIKSALENIYPAEIENCLKTHPAVADVCVIGVPDALWAQNVKAVVVLKEGIMVSESDLVDYCRTRIAAYKKPKIIEFSASLPKTEVGFIDRHAVDAACGGGGYPKSG